MPVRNDDSNEVIARITASLIVTCDSLDFDRLTEVLDCEPTATLIKGDPLGRARRPAGFSLWEVAVRQLGRSVPPVVDELLARFRDPAAAGRYLKEHGLEPSFEIGVSFSGVLPELVLKPEHLLRLSELGAAVLWDVNPTANAAALSLEPWRPS